MLSVSELVDSCQQDNPGSTNTLHLFLSTDSDVRRQSRSYTELSVTFSNMFGAVQPSGPVALDSPAMAPDGATRVGEADSKTYFKAAPGGAPGFGLWDNERKQLKLWLARDLPFSKTLGVSFQVDNAVSPQPAPNITVDTSGVTILFKQASDCWPHGFGPMRPAPPDLSPSHGGYCLMQTYDVPPPVGKGGPLTIIRPMFKRVIMGQSSPYPGAQNTLTVTLELNVELVPPGGHALPDVGSFSPGHPRGISLVFSNLLGASAPHHSTWLSPDSPTQEYGQDARCVNHLWAGQKCMEIAGAGAHFFKRVPKWNNDSKILEIFVVDKTPRDAEIVLEFQFVNNNTGQPSPNITIAARVVEIGERAVTKDSDTNLLESANIYKAKPGDAHPLLVYTPAFEYKDIGQTSPYPGAVNSLIITLSFNVDVPKSCDYHDAVYLNISMLVGGESFDGTIPFSDPGLPGPQGAAVYGDSNSVDSTELLGALPSNASEFSKGLVYWNGLNGHKRYFAKVMQDIEAGRVIIIQVDIVNGVHPQESPDVKIMSSGKSTGTRTSKCCVYFVAVIVGKSSHKRPGREVK